MAVLFVPLFHSDGQIGIGKEDLPLMGFLVRLGSLTIFALFYLF